MDTSTALQELTRVVKTYRAAEHLEEVLKMAEMAEGRQSELDAACAELEGKKASLASEVEALSQSAEQSKADFDAQIASLETDHRQQIEKFQKEEDAAREAVENLRTAYKQQAKEFEEDMAAVRSEKEEALEVLESKLLNTQSLLEDTRAKFKAVASG